MLPHVHAQLCAFNFCSIMLSEGVSTRTSKLQMAMTITAYMVTWMTGQRSYLSNWSYIYGYAIDHEATMAQFAYIIYRRKGQPAVLPYRTQCTCIHRSTSPVNHTNALERTPAVQTCQSFKSTSLNFLHVQRRLLLYSFPFFLFCFLTVFREACFVSMGCECGLSCYHDWIDACEACFTSCLQTTGYEARCGCNRWCK